MQRFCVPVVLFPLLAVAACSGERAERVTVESPEELFARLAEADAAGDDEAFLDLAEQGLLLDPEAPRAHALLAYALHEVGDLDRALREIDIALEKAEEVDPKLIGCHAMILASRGDYPAATREINRLSKLEPAFPVPRHEIDDEDLAYGEAQVAEMLDDQPTMTESLDEVPGLRDWAVRMFAGELLGQRVQWTYALPQGRNSLHLPPGGDHAPMIGLNDRRFERGVEVGDATFEQMWSSLVLEAYRIVGPSWTQKAEAMRDETVDDERLRNEVEASIHMARLQRRVFYGEEFLTWADRGGFETDPQLWDVIFSP